MLTVDKIAFGYGSSLPLFQKIHCEIRAGDVIQVCGPNGAGKTTFLKCLAGMESVSVGRIVWSQRPSYAFLPQMTALQFHIDMTFDDILKCSLGRFYDKAHILNLGIMTNVDLQREWNNASGGERQKLLLSKTLLSQKRLILLDEPLNHLDASTSESLASILERHIKCNPESAVVFVSHQENLRFSALRHIHLQENGLESVS